MNDKTLESIGAANQPPVTQIEPRSGWLRLDLKDVAEFSTLLYWLAWRDVNVRYRQTSLGVFWALLQPLAMMLVFSLFLGTWARVRSDGIPYAPFVLAGLVPWSLFATTLNTVSGSLVGNSALISKVYFPRLVISLSSLAAPMVEFAISFVLLVALTAAFGRLPSWPILLTPFFALLGVLLALGGGLWLGSLSVRYRDIFFVLPLFIQICMFLSPVVYPVSLVPADWRDLYALNPMVPVVEGIRYAVFGIGYLTARSVGASLLVTCALMIFGLAYFRRTERTFADQI